MKVGDMIRVQQGHWSDGGMIGILLEDQFPSEFNKGKAWKVLFSNGKIKTKLGKHLEVINE